MIKKWLKKKLIKNGNGLPVMYIIYKPQKELPNVFTLYIHPELRDAELEELLRKVSDKVRGFYRENPNLLQEILKTVKTGGAE